MKTSLFISRQRKNPQSSLPKTLKGFWKKLSKNDSDSSLRETLEELIEESLEEEPSIESDERQLLGNVLNLKDLTAADVMVPRADIMAAPITVTEGDLVALFVKTGITQLPIYRDTLDNIVGTVHIKDLLAWFHAKNPFAIKNLLKEVIFISPAMRTLDLLLQMRETGCKMAVVVDEFGGVDGLVTFECLIEEIIGDIQEAHDQEASTQIQVKSDGTIVADARTTLEEVEEVLGIPLALSEEDIDTLGGLVVFIAGRVPIRGELIRHPSGVEFEVLEADPRCIRRLCIRNGMRA
ncbi:MAG: hemolysin family protein [Alphaproteobacteria bacterium]|nr:hemolysin family protein [Alphaproteobacteria bacterium]